LGPFYYYFIAPWLLLFRFNPLGLAFGVAFFSSLYLLLNYFLVKDLFDKKTALISIILITFSSVLIDSSRYSWNPNLLPLFTLLTVYFLIKSCQANKILFYLLTGAFLSFAIQLHYLALFLISPILIRLIIQIIEVKDERKKTIFNSCLALFSFLFFSLPLLIFDLRHNFLNSKNFILLFKSSGNIVTNKLTNLISTFADLNTYTFNLQFNKIFLIAFLIVLLVAFLTLIRKKSNIRTFFIFFIFLLLGISLYSGPKYPHYFGVIYPFYYIIVAYFLSFLSFRFLGNFSIMLFFVVFILLNSKAYYFLSQKGSNQITKAKKISEIIYKNIRVENKKFTVSALPYKYSDSTYRYFLEIWGKKPIEKDSLEKADELFVVCEEKCQPIGDPQWDIAYFAPKKISGTWFINNVKIYKLIH
jgi:4-amino-4-deoxy-L-arabinose transferase-like glycosyltransferase